MSNYENNKKIHLEIKESLDEHKRWANEINDDLENIEDFKVKRKIISSNTKNPKSNKKEKRWEKLYELDKIKKDTREYLKNNYKEEDSDDIVECTFKPKIWTSNVRTNVPFLERNNAWVNKKNEKLSSKINKKEDKELENFTYQPHINKLKYKESDFDHHFKNDPAIEKFLERQELARNEKQRRDQIINFKNSCVKNITPHKKLNEYKPENYNINDNFKNKLEGKSFATNIKLLHKYLNEINIV